MLQEFKDMWFRILAVLSYGQARQIGVPGMKVLGLTFKLRAYLRFLAHRLGEQHTRCGLILLCLFTYLCIFMLKRFFRAVTTLLSKASVSTPLL